MPRVTGISHGSLSGQPGPIPKSDDPVALAPGTGICICLTGTIEFQTGARIYVISEGQGGLLPSNMLHMVNPYRRQRGSTYCAVLADPYLLHGLSGGAVETRYVSSLTGSGEDFFLFDNSCSWHGKILDFIHEMYFIIIEAHRQNLCHFFFSVSQALNFIFFMILVLQMFNTTDYRFSVVK